MRLKYRAVWFPTPIRAVLASWLTATSVPRRALATVRETFVLHQSPDDAFATVPAEDALHGFRLNH